MRQMIPNYNLPNDSHKILDSRVNIFEKHIKIDYPCKGNYILVQSYLMS